LNDAKGTCTAVFYVEIGKPTLYNKEKYVLDNPIKYYPIIFVQFYSCNIIISFQLKTQIFSSIIVTHYTV
jgi:hypothetical protein